MKSHPVKFGYRLAAMLIVCSVPGLAGPHPAPRLATPNSATPRPATPRPATPRPATPRVATPRVADISGIVRDSHGTPQVGAVVELLRTDAGISNPDISGPATTGSSLASASVVSRVFTDRHGHFSLDQVQPGTYSIQAVATAFLPALRQNLKIRTNTVVNLTLSTLFEAGQWLPAEKRSGNQPDDDWTWTLRSSANRPLLRMLDGGAVILVGGEANHGPATRTRVTASGGVRSFGEGDMRSTFEVQHSADDSKQLILRTRLSTGGTAALESMAAYRHEVAPGHTMRTMLSVQDQSEVRGPSGVDGMQSLVLRSSDVLKLTDHVVADAGSEFEAIKLGRINIVSHPFGGLSWTQGANSASYRVSTSRTALRPERIDAAESMSLPISIARGTSQVEHGLHQEISITRKTAHLEMQLAAFHDHVIDPVVSGGGLVKAEDGQSGELLLDPSTELFHASGQSYSGSGVTAQGRQQLGADTWITIQCADGSALSLGAVPVAASMLQILNELRPRNVQVYSIALSGRVDGSGTHWRTSYRWQPADTVTAVAPFESSPEAAYLSVYLRQPIHFSRLPGGMDAVIDVRNLLAEGYRPFVTSDGSTLYLAQTQRSIQGGVSFSF